MTFQNPEHAFNAAIKSGRLSANQTAANFAGNYMYMGTDANDNDLFKHIDTRQYLPIEHDDQSNEESYFRNNSQHGYSY